MILKIIKLKLHTLYVNDHELVFDTLKGKLSIVFIIENPSIYHLPLMHDQTKEIVPKGLEEKAHTVVGEPQTLGVMGGPGVLFLTYHSGFIPPAGSQQARWTIQAA